VSIYIIYSTLAPTVLFVSSSSSPDHSCRNKWRAKSARMTAVIKWESERERTLCEIASVFERWRRTVGPIWAVY